MGEVGPVGPAGVRRDARFDQSRDPIFHALPNSAGYAVSVDDVGELDRLLPHERHRHGRKISGHGVGQPLRPFVFIGVANRTSPF
jgi:hypothetical protein